MALLPAAAFPEVTGGSEDDALDEIIVTARKVRESVQDIPMSVQVLSGKLLDEVDLSRLYELQFNIPGLVVNNLGHNGAGFALRGIADQGGSSQSVATHLNGVYLGRSNLAIVRMFDLERIEVLKGPQGTLYGRNATGGSINFITRAPADEFAAGIEASYGSFATTRVQGHVDLPFQKAAVRVAFLGSEGDGYIRNSVDDRRFAENDFWGLRGTILAEPTDKLQLSFMAQRVKDDGESGELWTPRPDFLVDPSDIRLTTVTLANPSLSTQMDNVSLNIEYQLGSVVFHSITGYAESEVYDLDDCAGLPVLRDCVRGVDPANYEQFSQEFQLTSRDDMSVGWLIGAYYFTADGSRNFYTLIPLRNPNPLNDGSSESSEKAYAVFGQATWHFAERWRTTGGLRFSSEEHHLSTIGTGAQDSPTLVTSENDWDNVSWRFDLEYDAADDVLVYAGVSTGFKGGGILILPGGVPDSFDPEDLTAYEAGVKAQWLDRRFTLNGSAFFYDFRDLQVNTVTITDTGVLAETDNAAKAEVYGIDTDGMFRFTDRLTVSGGVVWLPQRKFIEYRNDATGDTLSGNDLSRAPEWSATTAISYEFPFLSRGNLSARVEYNYRSEFFFTKENDPNYAQGSFGLLNLYLRFESMSESWYAFATGRNLGNVDYFNQVFLQSSPGYPVTYEVGFGYRF